MNFIHFSNGKEAPRHMIPRRKALVMLGGLATGLALVFSGCSESPPPDAAVTGASIPQPETPEQPEPPAAKGKQSKDPFYDMSMREKREWRRQQKAKSAGE